MQTVTQLLVQMQKSIGAADGNPVVQVSQRDWIFIQKIAV